MLLLNVLLMGIWVLLTNDWTLGNASFGFVLSFLLLGLTERAISLDVRQVTRERYFRKTVFGIGFILYFLKEMVLASLQVFVSILSPFSRLRPGVIAIPLDLKSDAAITLLGNVITLTPGTLTLDVSTDKKVIYVHSIWVDDPESFRRAIKEGFERRICELME